jgi:hypothetical protein
MEAPKAFDGQSRNDFHWKFSTDQSTSRAFRRYFFFWDWSAAHLF